MAISSSAPGRRRRPSPSGSGITAAEIDVLMAYDSFSITVMCLIEDLGFCKKGEGGAYVGDGTWFLTIREASPEYRWRRLVVDHRGQRGIFLLFEATGSSRGNGRCRLGMPNSRLRWQRGSAWFTPRHRRDDSCCRLRSRQHVETVSGDRRRCQRKTTAPFSRTRYAALLGGDQTPPLTYQTCDTCDAVVFYSRRHCTSCGAGTLAT